MKRLNFSIWLFCLLLVFSACKSDRSNPMSKETLDFEKNIKTLTLISPTTVHNEGTTKSIKSTILPTVIPKSLSLMKTVTPTRNMVRQTICSPLQYETIASLADIVTDPYNPPLPGRDERHHGVDLSYYKRGDLDTIEGVGIQAIMAGYVAAVIKDRLPYGNMVIIETPNSLLPQAFRIAFSVEEGESLYHLYAHMQSDPLVVLDEMVACGRALGEVGMTGYGIVNPHLHLETRIGIASMKFSGMAFYTTDATIEEMENYQRWRTSGDFRHFDPMILFSWFLYP